MEKTYEPSKFENQIYVKWCKEKYFSTKPNKNKKKLNEVTHSIFYAPLYVAMNKGYFAEEGLTVNLTNGGGSDTSMKSLVANSA